jgi:hypothetical protein
VTAPVPDRVSDAGDLIDRVLALGDPETAVSSLIGALRSGRGRDPLRSALERRLGEGGERGEIAQRLSVRGSESGSHLLREIADFIRYGSATEAADDLARILSNAVEGGTSEERLRFAFGAVIEAFGALPGPHGLTRPVIRNVQAPPAAAPVAPSRTGVPPQSRRAPTTPTRQTAPSRTGASPFRVPDAVERIGTDRDRLIAPLFRPTGEGRGPGPVRVPAALPAPPVTDDPELIRSWLRGEPAFLDSLGVRAGLLETGDPGDLMELEAEFHADPKGALRLYKARAPMTDGTADAAWCARLGRYIGRFGVTHDRGVEILAAAIARHLRTREPEASAPLQRSGAILTVREELAEAVCGLIDTEQDYLSDGPVDVSGPPQNLQGSFSPNADLSGGLCLERALFLNMVISVPLGTAMRQSLTEFRIAQAVRANPDAPVAFLDRRYAIDAALPLVELCGRAPIVRIGFTEPAL